MDRTLNKVAFLAGYQTGRRLSLSHDTQAIYPFIKQAVLPYNAQVVVGQSGITIEWIWVTELGRNQFGVILIPGHENVKVVSYLDRGTGGWQSKIESGLCTNQAILPNVITTGEGRLSYNFAPAAYTEINYTDIDVTNVDSVYVGNVGERVLNAKYTIEITWDDSPAPYLYNLITEDGTDILTEDGEFIIVY